MTSLQRLAARCPVQGRLALRCALIWIAPPLALLLAAGAAADLLPPALLINETPSLPRGLYVRVPGGEPQRGSIAALAQPPAARPYLAQLGVPPGMPLIKRVAAVGGDYACADGRALIAPFRNVRVRGRDRRERPLPLWIGCRRLQAGEVLLLGDSPNSFDGRYFGPVRRDQLLGVYRPVLTW